MSQTELEVKKNIDVRKFEPQSKELFYFVTMGTSGFNVSAHLFGDEYNDKERVAFGNSFATRDEVDFVKEKLNQLFKSL
ncbi:MAG: hypothetical protein WA082_04325 [Candidatus Moraniibacteriota bacterium]